MSLLKTGRPTNKQKAIERVQEIAEETIRMNVNILRGFYKQIKQKALDENITVTELVSKAVKEYISK
jgi:hypothetical protein